MSPAKHNTSSTLQNALSELSQTKNMALQWIPSHCDIRGNEETDKLFKAGSEKNTIPIPHLLPRSKNTHSTQASTGMVSST